MLSNEDVTAIEHMLAAIQSIEEFVAGMDFAGYQQDAKRVLQSNGNWRLCLRLPADWRLIRSNVCWEKMVPQCALSVTSYATSISA